jgi:hypothetical protein
LARPFRLHVQASAHEATALAITKNILGNALNARKIKFTLKETDMIFSARQTGADGRRT